SPNGWLAEGIDPKLVRVVEPHPSEKLRDLARSFGFAISAQAHRGMESDAAVVLATSPQAFSQVAGSLESILVDRYVLLSIMAGITHVRLRQALAGRLHHPSDAKPSGVGRPRCDGAGRGTGGLREVRDSVAQLLATS